MIKQTWSPEYNTHFLPVQWVLLYAQMIVLYVFSVIYLSFMIINNSPLQFKNIKPSHRLTVLAGEEDLRAPSRVYHISWYPGANSCLVKDSTNSGTVCKRIYVMSDIQSTQTATIRRSNVEKYTVWTGGNGKKGEAVSLQQPTAHKRFILRDTLQNQTASKI